MANEIEDKHGSHTVMTITLAGLASSIAGVGQQSTLVDNSTDRFTRILLYVQVQLGTSPTANTTVFVYLIRSDKKPTGTKHRSDGAGDSDTGITIVNSRLIGTIGNPAGTSNALLRREFVIDNPGPEWGIAIVHNTGVALNASPTNQWARFIGVNPEVQ